MPVGFGMPTALICESTVSSCSARSANPSGPSAGSVSSGYGSAHIGVCAIVFSLARRLIGEHVVPRRVFRLHIGPCRVVLLEQRPVLAGRDRIVEHDAARLL